MPKFLSPYRSVKLKVRIFFLVTMLVVIGTILFI